MDPCATLYDLYTSAEEMQSRHSDSFFQDTASHVSLHKWTGSVFTPAALICQNKPRLYTAGLEEHKQEAS